MVVLVSVIAMYVDDLRREFFDVLRHERVLVLANFDVDAVCSVKILQYLFKCEQILHTLVPVKGTWPMMLLIVINQCFFVI